MSIYINILLLSLSLWQTVAYCHDAELHEYIQKNVIEGNQVFLEKIDEEMEKVLILLIPSPSKAAYDPSCYVHSWDEYCKQLLILGPGSGIIYETVIRRDAEIQLFDLVYSDGAKEIVIFNEGGYPRSTCTFWGSVEIKKFKSYKQHHLQLETIFEKAIAGTIFSCIGSWRKRVQFKSVAHDPSQEIIVTLEQLTVPLEYVKVVKDKDITDLLTTLQEIYRWDAREGRYYLYKKYRMSKMPKQ